MFLLKTRLWVSRPLLIDIELKWRLASGSEEGEWVLTMMVMLCLLMTCAGLVGGQQGRTGCCGPSLVGRMPAAMFGGSFRDLLQCFNRSSFDKELMEHQPQLLFSFRSVAITAGTMLYSSRNPGRHKSKEQQGYQPGKQQPQEQQ